MATGRGGLSYEYSMDTKVLRRNLKGMPGKIDRGIAGIVKARADISEGWMKTNASWTDRTGNARSGLATVTQHNPLVSHAIILFGKMPYQIWLETKFAGRDAIIIPALQDQGRKMMLTINKLFARLGGGESG